MKKLVFFAALLIAWPLLAQNPPAQTPPDQNPPAQAPPVAPGESSSKPSQTPPDQTQTPPAQSGESSSKQTQPSANPPVEQPKLEQPQMEAPPDAAPAPITPAKKPDTPAIKPAKKPASEGKVVEEIIARVNNEIITKSELDKAREESAEDAQQQCSGKCTPEQLQVATEDAQKFALRDLIDRSLLAQRGKDMDINVEADLVKQLDQIRQQNKLKDMDDLEKAVTAQGINWDDFKNNLKNRLLTQEVIRREVGSHINITHDEEMKYYQEHQKDFIKPEQVALTAIEIKTEGKKESEIPDLKAKAQKLHDRIVDGEDFSELAKRFSDGATAQQGGYLGVYKRGELSKELEDLVFKMNRNQITDVIETKQGFLILKVLEHYDEGEQPFDKVENEIQEQLYSQKMEPALREYLKTLREQSYVVVKPGYQDMAGGGNSEIQEVSATPETTKEKKGHKKYLLFGKTTGT
ncbi:MAG TPA: peptidylprolyl isomerase [Candidatus Sulfotelmatobacter sp.]|nr:peptidylprolyl isomerase [Candidatus Sulfotelmatobacter sp.]